MKKLLYTSLVALAFSAPAFAIQFDNVFYSGTPQRILDGLTWSTTSDTLYFNTPNFFTTSSSRFADLTIKYDAFSDQGGPLLDDMLLKLDVTVRGNAFVHVEETIRDLNSNAILAQISRTYTDSGLKEEHVNYSALTDSIRVYKDITIVAQNGDSYAAVAGIWQTPSEIPEPATLSLAALGGLAVWRRLKRV